MGATWNAIPLFISSTFRDINADRDQRSHLYRGRLFSREVSYPWNQAKNRKGKVLNNRTAEDDLDEAKRIILGNS